MTTNNAVRTSNAVAYVLLAFASLVVLVPVAWMLATALKPSEELFSQVVRWLPVRPTLDAFARVFTDYPFATYFANSIVVVTLSTVIAIAFATFAGYGVSRFEFRGRGSLMTFLLLTQMFPSIMLLIPYFKLFQNFGLIDTRTALVIVYVSFQLPLCTWMMVGYFRSIPTELDSAAEVDGAGRVRTFFQIILPLTMPGVAATAIYAFISGWNEYLFALVLTSSEDKKTVPVGIGQLIGQYRIEWNDLMAASLYALVPLTLIFIFLQKRIVSGMTAGAVK
ncbi:Inner membrane ABC transporter permease protein YcjP [Microbacterium oxydans]|uniref:Inner membrane ABC transporter permease protein YcjP n=2 Tax=Microbacterium oxydans TaxID=82380 RepID=A0A0F0L2D1_9MICO|nr:Inner membrane ABC transporter permease protein YcjP [Microbacterium oxydans]